jgi:hypothetical protein
MISIVRGNDKAIVFTVKTATNEAYSLVGHALYGTVKQNFEDTDENAKIADTLTLTAPLSGIATWTIEDTDTTYMLGNYFMDVKLVLSTGGVYTIYRDILQVVDRITRRITAL